MQFRFRPLEFQGMVLIEPQAVQDRRGVFLEIYRSSEFTAAGLPSFVQDNLSRSIRGTLRGLHYQRPPASQGKLVSVVSGEIFDVAVDLRGRSPTFRKWNGLTLSEENGHMVYIPEGFAHGFCVLSASAVVLYKVTVEYAPELDAGIIWNDPQVAVRWPVAAPVLSEKDAGLPPLSQARGDFADWSD